MKNVLLFSLFVFLFSCTPENVTTVPLETTELSGSGGSCDECPNDMTITLYYDNGSSLGDRDCVTGRLTYNGNEVADVSYPADGEIVFTLEDICVGSGLD